MAHTSKRPRSVLRALLTNEASGGMVLMGVAALALIIANSPVAPLYLGALKAYVAGLSVLHWINDGLMAVFFLLVGLEIKREFLVGQLSTWSRRILPGVAATGGMIIPAVIYLVLNMGNPANLRGWAIPTATDIAFALGVLALLGPRVPVSLKVFLTALAILDDLGAVMIIAVFYTVDLSVAMLELAAVILLVLVLLNRTGVRSLWPYLLAGIVLWYFVLKSGVHATLAGVALALTIPLEATHGHPEAADSPLHRLEHALHPWVAFLIVPIFGFANAGVTFAGISLSALADPVPMGVVLGLFIGKQIGVFGLSWVAIRLNWADLPANAGWAHLYGLALLCGIGFTMSLFIGLLAFPSALELQDKVKIGVLLGSLVSGAIGALVLWLAQPKAMVVAATTAKSDPGHEGMEGTRSPGLR
jgi:Na+:H+ antiporter, NhaA family